MCRFLADERCQINTRDWETGVWCPCFVLIQNFILICPRVSTLSCRGRLEGFSAAGEFCPWAWESSEVASLSHEHEAVITAGWIAELPCTCSRQGSFPPQSYSSKRASQLEQRFHDEIWLLLSSGLLLPPCGASFPASSSFSAKMPAEDLLCHGHLVLPYFLLLFSPCSEHIQKHATMPLSVEHTVLLLA